MLSSHTVSRAVARSRAVRASVAKRRRRRIALIAGIGAMLGAPVAWWMAEPAAAVAAAAVSQAQDFAELLNQRSPGIRTQDQLTKHARVAPKVRKAAKPVVPVADLPITPSVTELVDLLQPQPVPVEIASANITPVLASSAYPVINLRFKPGRFGPGHRRRRWRRRRWRRWRWRWRWRWRQRVVPVIRTARAHHGGQRGARAGHLGDDANGFRTGRLAGPAQTAAGWRKGA